MYLRQIHRYIPTQFCKASHGVSETITYFCLFLICNCGSTLARKSLISKIFWKIHKWKNNNQFFTINPKIKYNLKQNLVLFFVIIQKFYNLNYLQNMNSVSNSLQLNPSTRSLMIIRQARSLKYMAGRISNLDFKPRTFSFFSLQLRCDGKAIILKFYVQVA